MCGRKFIFYLIFGLFLCLSQTILAPTKATADTVFTIGSNTYLHDGNVNSIDVAPQISNERTLVPVRYLAESCGADVSWNEAKQTVTLTHGQTTIQLTIGSNQELVNGQAVTMDTAPVIINDRTMLPARWVAENIGQQISWDEQNQTVTIFPKKVTIQVDMQNVRQSPGLEYSLLGMLPRNTTVKIINDLNDWYQIDLPDGSKGWLAGWLTAASDNEPTANISLIQPTTDPSANNGNTGSNTSRGGTQSSSSLFSGLGVWASIYSEVPDSSDIAKFKSAGVKRIYIEVATTTGGFPKEWQNWIDNVVPAAHRAGIKVIGWAYTSLNDPASDAALIAQVSNYQTPGGDQLDAVAADIEDLPENDITQAQNIVTSFTSKAWSSLRAGCPLLAITYPPQQRPNYPFSVMSQNFNGLILMDYWHSYERTYSKDEVAQFINNSASLLNQAGCNVPVDLALEGCDIGAGMVTANEVAGAVSGARASGVSYSLYTYETSNDIWNAFIN